MNRKTNLLQFKKKGLLRLEVQLNRYGGDSNLNLDEIVIYKPAQLDEIPFKVGDSVYLLSKNYARSFKLSSQPLKCLKIRDISDHHLDQKVDVILNLAYDGLLRGMGTSSCVLLSKEDLDEIIGYDLSKDR